MPRQIVNIEAHIVAEPNRGTDVRLGDRLDPLAAAAGGFVSSTFGRLGAGVIGQ